MEKVYRNFYRNFYLNTGGFIPTRLLGQNTYPGDFFQIRNGEIIVLGNIFRNLIIDPKEYRPDEISRLNPANWSFGDGVTKPYSGRGVDHGILGELGFSKQILAFNDYGSFLFKGNNPESKRLMNWNHLYEHLIIKLTRTIYSFREVYLVTETVTLSDWTLAVASSGKAELEIATENESIGLFEVFGNAAAKTIQSRDIEFYGKGSKRRPNIFKAKKLVVQDERRDIFISELMGRMQGQDDWASDFFEEDFNSDQGGVVQFPTGAQASLLDMLPANQLNANTALQYFRWGDANLDDIEKLFVSYGD